MSSNQHVVPVRTYALIFGCLLVLTGVTVAVSTLDLGFLNNIAALGIACTKAVLVVLFFMHARTSTRLIKIVIASGFVWLLILLLFTLSDYWTRGILTPVGQ